jgi:hypothetical protein
MKLALAAIFAACILSSCSVGPNYQQPEMEMVQEFQRADSTMYVTDSLGTLSDTTWWELFEDTVLTNLVRSALNENVDVKIAAARVEQLMGQYGVEESEFWPKFDVGAGADRGQYLAAPTNADGVRVTSNRFQVNLSASWEIDLWGKVRRASEGQRPISSLRKKPGAGSFFLQFRSSRLPISTSSLSTASFNSPGGRLKTGASASTFSSSGSAKGIFRNWSTVRRRRSSGLRWPRFRGSKKA